MASSKSKKLSLNINKNLSQAIKQEMKIMPELEYLIPPLSQEEYKNLEASIKEEGCREPLIVWENDSNYILVDGHNRLKICKRNNLDFSVKTKSFKNIDEVKNWMLANQMSRRNLTPLQMSYLRGLRYETEKKTNGGLRIVSASEGQNAPLPKRTSLMLSEEYSVDEKTIRRDAKFTQGLNRLSSDNPQLRWRILNGQLAAKKQTVANLADQDDAFLEKLKSKFDETNNLEKAVTLLMALEGEGSSPKEVSEKQVIYKQIISLLKKHGKMGKDDPKRNKIKEEVFSLLDDYLA
jgi:hypothetical protein